MCTSWPCPKEQNGESSEMGKVRSLFIKSQTTCMITMVSQLTNYRYANMDFIVFHSLMGSKNKLLLFSYDIACQWSRNLSQHLVQLPNSMQLSDEQLYLLRFAIPKFHISVHGLDCQSNFSFNYQPYMAHMDGKDPERWWAHLNPVSMSMKEMGPGSWLDTLNDHAAAWNWWKITAFGAFSD